MVHFSPIDLDDPHLLFALTFLVAFDDGAEPREYYLPRSIEAHLDAMLTRLTNGDRDAARNFCAAMFLEFRREYEYGRLLALHSCSHNRALLFMPRERASFSWLLDEQLHTHKMIVTLGMTTEPFTFRRQ